MHRINNNLLPLTYKKRPDRLISETVQTKARPTLLLYEDHPPFPVSIFTSHDNSAKFFI